MSLLDDVARALAERSISRRETLRKLGAGVAASVFGVAATACDSPSVVSPIRVMGEEEGRFGVSAAADKDHCKRDDVPCKAHGECCTGYCDASGSCGCKSGTTNCGGTCTYTSLDPINCGACGNVCPAGTACLNGSCTAPCAVCPSSQTACGGICVNTQTSPQNCGACGNICAAGSPCVAGVCVPNLCREGFNDVGGICVPAPAGVCLTGPCPAGQSCNFGICTGENRCPPGMVNCNGLCIDPTTPCGACGLCAAGQSCLGGSSTCSSGSLCYERAVTAVLLLARVLLAGVFTVSGLAKLRDRDGTAKAARDFGVPASLSQFTARAMPVAELLLAVALIPRITAAYAAWSIGALLVAFTIAIAASILSGRRTACHCFGEASTEPVGWSSVLRNVALLAVSAFVAWPRDGGAGPGLLDLWNATDSASRPALGVALASVVIAIACAYACLGLLRQHGRMLLRIDALEHAAAAAAPAGGTASPAMQNGAHRHGGHPGVPAAAVTNTPRLPLGSPVPPFSLPRLDGRTVTDAALRTFERPVLLLFTDPHCGPCNTIAPDLERWATEHRDRFALVLVTRGDLAANRKKYGASAAAHVLYDKDLALANAIGAVPTPSAVTLSTDGRVQSEVGMGQHGIEALIAAITGAAPKHANSAPIVGRVFPPFDVPATDGRRVTNAVFAGRWTLLLFWNPGCGYSAQMLPGLRGWAESRPVGAPQVVLMSAGTAAEHANLGFSATVAFDDGFTIGNALGVPGTPSGMLVDAGGRIASEIAVGEDALWRLLGGKPAEVVAR